MATTPSFVLTYNSLVTTVQQYLERSDAAVQTQIPVAITLCEFKIAQQLKSLGQLQVVRATLQANAPTLQKPARWRKTVSMNIVVNGQKVPLLLRKYEYLRNYWPNAAQSDQPLYYADYNYDNWLIAPTPDQNYPIEIMFYERLQPLASDAQTNWLTQNAPNAILFGTLLEMTSFLKSDARIPVWQKNYDDAIAALKVEDTLRIGDRAAVVQDS